MNKKKTILIFIIVILIAGSIHIFRPRISQTTTNFGSELAKFQLNDNQRISLEQFINDHPNQIESLVINIGSKTAFHYGNIDKSVFIASVRKSILNLLFGIAISKGYTNLDKTLEDLGIDEVDNPLTSIEKTATIRNLLMARSGVYLESGAETKAMKKTRPLRGSHKPGEFFYYNNWDFNTLGYIFEKETGISIGEAISEWFAKPLGMQDYDSAHVLYSNDSGVSQYPVWRLFMSARDLSKIGSLLLNNGIWNNTEIVQDEWIIESTIPYSKSEYDEFGLYGYLWWIDEKLGIYAALGVGGQYLLVDNKNNICISMTKDIGLSIAETYYTKFFFKETSIKTLIELHSLFVNSIQT